MEGRGRVAVTVTKGREGVMGRGWRVPMMARGLCRTWQEMSRLAAGDVALLVGWSEAAWKGNTAGRPAIKTGAAADERRVMPAYNWRMHIHPLSAWPSGGDDGMEGGCVQ